MYFSTAHHFVDVGSLDIFLWRQGRLIVTQLSFDQMNLKTKYSSRSPAVSLQRIVFAALIILFAGHGMWCTDAQIRYCLQSILSLPVTKMTINSSLSQCSIPYEECRCSTSSNQFNDSINCITDIQARSRYILPPISFVVQLYVIYDLFSSTGGYCRIFLSTIWLAVLFVFIMTEIGTYEISCLYFVINWIVSSSAASALLPIAYLITHHDIEDHSYAYRRTNRRRRLVRKDHDRKVLTLVIVSWFQHHFVIYLFRHFWDTGI